MYHVTRLEVSRIFLYDCSLGLRIALSGFEDNPVFRFRVGILLNWIASRFVKSKSVRLRSGHVFVSSGIAGALE